MKRFAWCVLFAVLLASSCEKSLSKNLNPARELPVVSKEDFASALTQVGLGSEQVWEVFDAVAASDVNGYDEEYTLKNVISAPGYGVGEDLLEPKSYVETKSYAVPLRSLLAEYYAGVVDSQTKAGVGPISTDVDATQPEDYLTALEKGDMQIYWPFYEKWDGKALPVVTYDPGFEASTNVGVDLATGEEVIVDEALARTRPVWIVNSNNDAEHISMEIFSQRGPSWMRAAGVASAGGSASGRGATAECGATAERGATEECETKADDTVRTLVLKSFTSLRNYDNFFAGASEFFVKIGGIDHFTASTEAELKLYNPYVTDFMKVVKRKEVGQPIVCNTMLLSNWTKQLESCAFLICEDDGGTVTQWNAEAVVKVSSRSYGVTLSIPINSKDDIVWRGALSCDFLYGYIGETVHFGDVDLIFDFLEY